MSAYPCICVPVFTAVSVCKCTSVLGADEHGKPVLMSNLTDCISQLDNAALDVFEVGCRWQEKTPASMADYSDLIAGVLIMVGSVLLLWVLSELART